MLPAKPGSDPRHFQLRLHIAAQYRKANDLECPWDGHAAKCLANLLKSLPWPLERLQACVDSRFDSEDVNLAETPVRWIPRLPNYARGPLDKYQRPIYKLASSHRAEVSSGFESADDYYMRKEAEKGTIQ